MGVSNAVVRVSDVDTGESGCCHWSNVIVGGCLDVLCGGDMPCDLGMFRFTGLCTLGCYLLNASTDKVTVWSSFVDVLCPHHRLKV